MHPGLSAGEVTIRHQGSPTIFCHESLSNLMLDIGGEGRHSEAWNLNPSRVRTLGPHRGRPIPKLIPGRAEAIPLPSQCVDVILVERTPLRIDALREIQRVIRADGTIILRHSLPPIDEPHRTACTVLPGRVFQRRYRVSGRWMQETVFRCNDRQLFDRERPDVGWRHRVR